MVFLFAAAYITSKVRSDAAEGFQLCSVVRPMRAIRKKKKNEVNQR